MSRHRQPDIFTRVVETVTATQVKKMQHVEAQEINEKMTKGQKEGIRVWNEMRDTLIKAGLMETN